MTDWPDLTNLQMQIMHALTGEDLAAEVNPAELGGLPAEALAKQLGATEEEIAAAMRGLIDFGFIEHVKDEERNMSAPYEWLLLFRDMARVRADYPYPTCTRAPDQDTHLIVGHLDMGLYLLILAMGLTPLPGEQFTCKDPQSEQEAQARALYAEVAIRMYGAVRALRGEIDPEFVYQAQEEIYALLPQAEALYQEHAVVNEGLPMTEESEDAPPFWSAMGFESFDAWLTKHRETIDD